MRAVSILALSLVAGVLGAPSMLSRDEDWKIPLGWDGKSITLADYQQSSANKSTEAKRALPGGIYLCQAINWGQPCIYITGLGDNQCITFGSDYNDKVSSFGPDPGLGCAAYSNADCKGWALDGGYYVLNPGYANLEQKGFNDVMSSFKCTYSYQ